MELSLFSQYPITCTIFYVQLGPGPGGPRMDRRAVTSLGVVKISRLALRLRRSARRGPDPTSVLIKLLITGCQECPSGSKTLRDRQAARNVPLVQKRYVTDRLPGMSLWSKNVT